MPWLLYAHERCQYPMHMRLGVPQSWSDNLEKEKSPSPGIQTPDHPMHSLVTILNMLSQLPTRLCMIITSNL